MLLNIRKLQKSSTILYATLKLRYIPIAPPNTLNTEVKHNPLCYAEAPIYSDSTTQHTQKACSLGQSKLPLIWALFIGIRQSCAFIFQVCLALIELLNADSHCISKQQQFSLFNSYKFAYEMYLYNFLFFIQISLKHRS